MAAPDAGGSASYQQRHLAHDAPLFYEALRLTNLENLFLSGNHFTGCIPGGLRDVPENDLSELGLPFCSA